MGIIKKYDLQCDFCENKLSDNYKQEVKEFNVIGQIMHFAKDNSWDYKKLKGIRKQKWRCPECRTKKVGEIKTVKKKQIIIRSLKIYLRVQNLKIDKKIIKYQRNTFLMNTKKRPSN